MPLTRQEADARAQKLRTEIEHHSYRYYALDTPEISDAAYDSLVRELTDIEAEFPELVTADSPTQRVGAPPSEQFAQVEHASRMYSLDNAMDLAELDAWLVRVRDALGERPCAYVCELKIDGSSLALTYRDGSLVRVATRGDGRVGEDVTVNVRTIRDVPLRMRPAAAARARVSEVEVRGEVYLPHEAFARLNAEQELSGGTLFANPRNAAAGSVRQKDASVTASRDLATFIYAVASPRDLGLDSAERDPRLASRCRLPREPRRRGVRRRGRGSQVLRGRARAPGRPSVRDRRRRGQGRLDRTAGGARLYEQGSTLGNRLQVPARGEDHRPRGYSSTGGTHRSTDPARRVRAREGRWARRSPARPSTTKTRSRERTSASATPSSCARPVT